MASRSSARRRLARARTSRTARRRGALSRSETETTRNDGREGSGTLAASPWAMNATRSLAARGVRWKVSTHRPSRQRLTLMNPCAGRQVARRPTPRSSMTMWRPSISGSSWSLLCAAISPLSRDSGGHASGTCSDPERRSARSIAPCGARATRHGPSSISSFGSPRRGTTRQSVRLPFGDPRHAREACGASQLKNLDIPGRVARNRSAACTAAQNVGVGAPMCRSSAVRVGPRRGRPPLRSTG